MSISKADKLESYQFFILQLIVFSLPFYRQLVPPFIALFTLVALMRIEWQGLKRSYKKWKSIIWICSSFYLVHLLSLLINTDYIVYGLVDLETKFSLLLFPWVIFLSMQLNEERIQSLMQIFLFANLTALIICFSRAGYHFFSEGDSSYFYYHKLSYFRHPGYFALYLNVCIILATTFIFYLRDRLNYWYFILILIFIIGIYQLASRNAILSMFGILGFNFFYFVIPSLKWRKSFITFLAVIALSTLIINNASFVSKRFESANNQLNESFSEDDDLQDNRSGDVRLLIWKEAIYLAVHHPFLGVGVGDIKEELMARYKEQNIEKAQIKRYNAHNQYLQSAAAIGLPGLLALLGMLAIPFFFAIKHKLYLNGMFVFACSFSFLTESILERQDGVVFFSLFTIFMWYNFDNRIGVLPKYLQKL